jgi:TonB family protein
VRERAVAVIERRERAFWIALACAAFFHAALIVGTLRSPPRQMGEASGRPDGISVELVDSADLDAKNTFAQEGAQNPAANPAKQQPPPQAAAQPQPKPEPPAPKAEPTPPAEAAAAPPPLPKAAEQKAEKASPWAVEKEALDQASPPEAAAEPQPKQAEPQPKPPAKKQQAEPHHPPQPKPQPQQKQALNFDLPPQAFDPGSTGAAVARPAGITRSGENDDFGRGVIRALRRTMPASNVRGRVTVRFLLSDTGNLVEVRLVNSAGDPILDQNVVFAVKQSSFPIPPANSTLVDRTFLITYVYH